MKKITRTNKALGPGLTKQVKKIQGILETYHVLVATYATGTASLYLYEERTSKTGVIALCVDPAAAIPIKCKYWLYCYRGRDDRNPKKLRCFNLRFNFRNYEAFRWRRGVILAHYTDDACWGFMGKYDPVVKGIPIHLLVGPEHFEGLVDQVRKSVNMGPHLKATITQEPIPRPVGYSNSGYGHGDHYVNDDEDDHWDWCEKYF